MNIVRDFSHMQATWPNPSMPSLWSPRPDPGKLLHGDYDADFINAMKTAPPGSMLSTWHEAEQSGIKAADARKVHAYMHKLVHANSALPYGIITSQGASKWWDVEGMDFYGGDIYDLHGTGDFRSALASWASQRPQGRRVIAETNSMHPAKRAQWFAGVYIWLLARKGLAMMTFWSPTGRLSGPWLNNDTTTIIQMNDIARASVHSEPLLP